MNSATIRIAGEIWDYLSAEKSVESCDAIVVCCSYDLRVCDHACELIERGYSDTLVLSGGSGNWTRHLWSAPEAEVFLERAVKNGLHESRILVEARAANFGENVRFSKDLIADAQTVTFVSKPNSLLRVKLTAAAQWPQVTALVSCPEISFPDEVSNVIGIWGLLNEMAGDLQRIQKYPELGYQAEHELPEEILDNWRYLIDCGFTHHLMPGEEIRPANPA